MFIWAPLSISKMLKIVLYILAHGIPLEWMVDLYNVETSIIWEYIIMICETLANHDNLFGIYIHTPSTS